MTLAGDAESMRLLIVTSTVLLMFFAVRSARSETASELAPVAILPAPTSPSIPTPPDSRAFFATDWQSAIVDERTDPRFAVPATQPTIDGQESSVFLASFHAAQPATEPLPSDISDELLDPVAAEIEQGGLAFDTRCTQCHNANRALAKRKSFSGWLATVRKMAARRDADVPPSKIVPIARYLASVSGISGDDAAGSDGRAEQIPDGGQFNFSGTISTLWRGGNDANVIENPGFFVDAWLSAEWQSSGPLNMKATACVTCHASQHDDRLELVEAFARLDLVKAWHGTDGGNDGGAQLNLSAGRVVVPFGAFAGMSHPGANRTATNPLMFNMGRLVNTAQIGPVVLPMPYADEGVVLDTRVPLACGWSATLDVYAINGMQGFTRISNFRFSRDWVDNNSDPAVGGRATIGNGTVRFGGSIMSGRFEPDSATNPVLNYQIVGADVTIRHGRWRGYAEYAMRRSDYLQGMTRGDEEVYGAVAEVEYQVLDCPQVSLLARYDNLVRDSIFQAPVGFRVERLTLGVNLAMPGGSLLMLNYERWLFSDPIRDVDIIGVRWVATF
jgi:hypothetical protein